MTAIRMVDTKEISHSEWLRLRGKGIGGSDIAAIAGLSPWRSPLAVYVEKTGEVRPEEETEAMRWGTILEAVIADEFKRRHPEYMVRRVNAILQHPEVPYFLANIDREVRQKGAEPMVLEIKTTSAWQAGRWRDDVPDHVMCQVQWYLGITGWRKGIVAVLIGGRDYREIEVERDDEIIGYLHEIGRRFWEEHVVPRIPPAAEASDSETLEQIHPESNGETIELPPTALDLIERYDQAYERFKEAKDELDAVKAQLQALLGDNERGVVGDRRVDWTTVTQTRFDTKRLCEEHPDIFEQYAKTITYRRFSVR